MKVCNIAVIGGGFMGKTHSLCAAALPFYYDMNVRPVLHTLCGRDKSKTETQAERYGFLHAETDFDSVINNPEIDVIDICTPNPLHYAQAKAAILAGKHVYCDKPLAVTAKEAAELAELAEKSNKVCRVTFQHRFWSAVIKARQLIDSGAVGEIISFRGVFLHSSLVDENKPYAWRNAPADDGGGVLNDLGSHLIDMIMYLCGEVECTAALTDTRCPKRRDSGGKIHEVTCDDAVYMLLRLKNGACGTAEASKLATGLNDVMKIEIHGKKGAVTFDLSRPDKLRFFDMKNGGFTDIDCMQKYSEPCDFLNGANLPGWIRAHIHSYFCFIAAANGKASKADPAPDFKDAAGVQRVIEQARKAAAGK